MFAFLLSVWRSITLYPERLNRSCFAFLHFVKVHQNSQRVTGLRISEQFNEGKANFSQRTAKRFTSLTIKATWTDRPPYGPLFECDILPHSCFLHPECCLDLTKALNPLTPRVKPWVIQSFLTFDSMDRTLKCHHSLESCWAVLNCGAVC